MSHHRTNEPIPGHGHAAGDVWNVKEFPDSRTGCPVPNLKQPVPPTKADLKQWQNYFCERIGRCVEDLNARQFNLAPAQDMSEVAAYFALKLNALRAELGVAGALTWPLEGLYEGSPPNTPLKQPRLTLAFAPDSVYNMVVNCTVLLEAAFATSGPTAFATGDGISSSSSYLATSSSSLSSS